MANDREELDEYTRQSMNYTGSIGPCRNVPKGPSDEAFMQSIRDISAEELEELMFESGKTKQ